MQVKIYYGCSISGGVESPNDPIPLYGFNRMAVSLIKEKGMHNLLPQIDKGPTLANFREWMKEHIFDGQAPTPIDLVEYDFDRLNEADAGIFEITQASHGVGIEIEHLRAKKIPLLLLYDARVRTEVSWMLSIIESSKYSPQQNSKILAYSSDEQAMVFMTGFLSQFIT